MIRRLCGKNQFTLLKLLIKNNTQITNIKDIADTLAVTFSPNSPTKNSKTEFPEYKDKKEKLKLNSKLDNTEIYNVIFSLSELKAVIQKSHKTALGPEETHYEFLRQRPQKSLKYLLTTFGKNQTPRIMESSFHHPNNWTRKESALRIKLSPNSLNKLPTLNHGTNGQ